MKDKHNHLLSCGDMVLVEEFLPQREVFSAIVENITGDYIYVRVIIFMSNIPTIRPLAHRLVFSEEVEKLLDDEANRNEILLLKKLEL